MNRQLRFWVGAVGAAVAFALAAALLFPYGWLGLGTAAERQHAWLLTVWTAGVFCILFGASSLLGVFSGIGFRDVAQAGSVREAADQLRETERERSRSRYYTNFGWWVVCTGGLLVLIYFAAWVTADVWRGSPMLN